MRNQAATLLLAGLVAACSPSAPARTSGAEGGAASTRGEGGASAQVLTFWRTSIDSLDRAAAQLDSAARSASGTTGVADLQRLFRSTRRQFKHLEVALEYYAPSTTRQLNGPPVPEVEEEEGPGIISPPMGLQVIEGILFGPDPLQAREALRSETGTLRSVIARARTMLGVQETTDAHVWDAARLEVARILTLGVASFDAALSGDALDEMDAALDGIVQTLAPYRRDEATWRRLEQTMVEARTMLRSGRSSKPFNYLAFIATRGQPLAHAMAGAQRALGIGTPNEHRAYRMQSASVFDSNAFDVSAFAPPGAESAPPARLALGAQLFADGRLSTTGRRSCQSCHDPSRAFTDGRARALGLEGRAVARNTPTVINSGLQVGSFADLRATYLEDQVTDVVQNRAEMHGSLTAAARALANDSAIRGQFLAAFPASVAPDSIVTPLRIRQALAAYMRSLTSLNTPVDRALRGDTLALLAEARAGFNLFVGKGRCAGCHFLPLTNGTVPPMYQRTEMEVLGVPARAVTRGATVDADLGRYAISRSEPHRYAFRTPGLRHVAETAPYMHNGVYATLEEVVNFYDGGGGAGIGVQVANQTLPTDSLHLTRSEKRQLLAFLKSLSPTVQAVPRSHNRASRAH